MLMIAVYAFASALRLAGNADDKLLPGLASFADALRRYAVEPDKPDRRNTSCGPTRRSSLARLGAGLPFATLISLSSGSRRRAALSARAPVAFHRGRWR